MPKCHFERRRIGRLRPDGVEILSGTKEKGLPADARLRGAVETDIARGKADSRRESCDRPGRSPTIAGSLES